MTQKASRSDLVYFAVVVIALALLAVGAIYSVTRMIDNNTRTTTIPSHTDGGSFLDYYIHNLPSPAPDSACHPTTLEQMMLPCDKP